MFGFNEYLFLSIAYLLGSIPFGAVLVKMIGLGDIRSQGSGNIGATNVVRVAGKKIGAVVFLLDLIKGFLPAYMYINCFGGDDMNKYCIAATAVLGHIFPVWLKFKGGKGVATGFGAILSVNPVLFLVAVGLWLIAYFTTKISSVSALVSYGLLPFVAFFVYQGENLMIFLFLLTLLIYFRHYANIKRLLNGEEKPFKKNKSAKL